ncbi:MAG: hypothetical protein ACI9LY_002874 [Arenicella sp.]|jgi:hypothetical protein
MRTKNKQATFVTFNRSLFISSLFGTILLIGSLALSTQAYSAPDPCSLAGQNNIDQCAWNTFAGYLENDTWQAWSSTSDLLDQKSPRPSGSRFIPEACNALSVANPNLRSISQVGKVADSIFEAGSTGSNRKYTWSGSSQHSNGIGVSGDPVIASNGTFIRYEIMINEIAYDWVVTNKLYKGSTLETWGGDLIFPDGSVVIKNAWMPLKGLPAGKFYTEELLVYTSPRYLSNSTDNTCEVQTMALVGQHIASKTSAQPAWTWATLEHRYAAPDCTAVQADSGVNQTCPTAADKTAALGTSGLSDFLLNPTSCSDGKCASCNTKPAFNCKDDKAYCIDVDPNASGGYTHSCRQVAPSYYRGKAGESQSTLSNDNYMLISTQWYNQGTKGDVKTGDVNIASTVRNNKNRGSIKPASTKTATTPTLSVLGNSTMETYERSNCVGCHSSSVYKQSNGTQISTDFMFWMTVEVPCGANGNDPTCEAAAPAAQSSKSKN